MVFFDLQLCKAGRCLFTTLFNCGRIALCKLLTEVVIVFGSASDVLVRT